MEDLSECCQAEIICNYHNRRNNLGTKKTWVCSECKLDVATKKDKVKPPPSAKYGME